MNYLSSAKKKIKDLESEGEMSLPLISVHFALIALYIFIDIAESHRAYLELQVRDSEYWRHRDRTRGYG